MRQEENETVSGRQQTKRVKIWITIISVVVAILAILYTMMEEQRLKEKYFSKG
jgi:hypothetical protein